MVEFVKQSCPYCGKEAHPKAEIIHIPFEDSGKTFPAICVYCSVCGKILKIKPIDPQIAAQTERK